MKLLGIQLRPPGSKELLGATLFIVGFVLLGVALEHYGFVERDRVLPTTLAFSMGVLLSASGVSLFRHGIRAWIIFGGASLIAVGLFKVFGVIQ